MRNKPGQAYLRFLCLKQKTWDNQVQHPCIKPLTCRTEEPLSLKRLLNNSWFIRLFFLQRHLNLKMMIVWWPWQNIVKISLNEVVKVNLLFFREYPTPYSIHQFWDTFEHECFFSMKKLIQFFWHLFFKVKKFFMVLSSVALFVREICDRII